MKTIFKGNNFAIVWNIIDSSTHTPFDFSGMKVEVGLYSECCKKAIKTYNISNGTIEFEVESEELQNGVYNLMCRYSTENEQAYCIYKRAFQITGKPEFASNVETIILESKASHIDATDHDDPIPDFENCQLIAQELFKENFRLPQLTADRAIADEHGNRIADTYVSREAVTKHIRNTYNQQFLENPPLITEGYITPQMLSDETRQLLEESGATINNLPDGEDLQSVHGVLKLANKQHNPNSYSGLGRQYLRKNIVAGQNILTQSMLQWPNTIYIIQYDFTLDEDITIPENCVLEFDGGSMTTNYNKINFRSAVHDKIKLSYFKEGLDDYKTFETLVNAYDIVIVDRDITIRHSIQINKYSNIYSFNNSIIKIINEDANILNKTHSDILFTEGANINGLVFDYDSLQRPYISNNFLVTRYSLCFSQSNSNVIINNCKFKNYYTTNTVGNEDSFVVIAIFTFKDRAVDIKDCNFNNIYVVGDGTQISTIAGFGKCIYLWCTEFENQETFNTSTNVGATHIDNCLFKNCYGVTTSGFKQTDDFDCIHAYLNRETNIERFGYKGEVSNCRFYNCGKRCVKWQAGHGVIRNITCYSEGAFHSIVQVFGDNNVIENVRGYLYGGTLYFGISISGGINNVVKNCLIQRKDVFNLSGVGISITPGTIVENCTVIDMQNPIILTEPTDNYGEFISENHFIITNSSFISNNRFGLIKDTFNQNTDYLLMIDNCVFDNTDIDYQQSVIINNSKFTYNIIYKGTERSTHLKFDRNNTTRPFLQVNNCSFMQHGSPYVTSIINTNRQRVTINNIILYYYKGNYNDVCFIYENNIGIAGTILLNNITDFYGNPICMFNLDRGNSSGIYSINISNCNVGTILKYSYQTPLNAAISNCIGVVDVSGGGSQAKVLIDKGFVTLSDNTNTDNLAKGCNKWDDTYGNLTWNGTAWVDATGAEV